jgi:hypothetical protein
MLYDAGRFPRGDDPDFRDELDRQAAAGLRAERAAEIALISAGPPMLNEAALADREMLWEQNEPSHDTYRKPNRYRDNERG